MKREDVAALVCHDIEQRVVGGSEQYGERLTTFNGRNAIWDAYEEMLDLALYIRQAIAEHAQILREAEAALLASYDARDFPADGTSRQELMAKRIHEFLELHPQQEKERKQ
jgi:hypothetical protein